MTTPASPMSLRSAKEYALVFSALPATVVGILVFSVPPIDRWTAQWLSFFLEVVCGASVPTFWCRVPRPVPWLAVVQFADYLVFLLASGYFVVWIQGGKYRKPPNFRAESLSQFHRVVGALVWLFVLAGGQVFPQRASPFSYFGLIFTVVAFSFALLCIRGLAIHHKFRQSNET